MPRTQISEADRKNIDPMFICVVCGWLLAEAMQTPCGHLLCFHCLETLLNSPSPTCPDDGTHLTKDSVFPDALIRREVMGLYLHCPNEGCDWSGTNKELQEHSKNCDHALIQCVHGQCKKEIKRSSLAQHLQQECLYREVNCDDCKEKLAFRLLEEHVNVQCLETLLPCKYCKKTGIRRKNMERHEKDECEEIPVRCEFIGCGEVGKRKEMHRHLSDGLLNHVWLLLKTVLDICAKVQNLIPRIDDVVTAVQGAKEEVKQLASRLKNEVDALAKNLAALVGKLLGLEKRVENIESMNGGGNNKVSGMLAELRGLKTRVLDLDGKYNQAVDRNRRLENELREKDAGITRLRERLDRIDTSIAESTVRLSDLGGPSPSQATTSCNGALLWKIDGFNEKRREAVSGAQIAIYSQHFYTSQFGYKMCVRIYMNGDGFGKNTHISLFFVIMKGEYDALLPWPFQKKITMMLLDQNNGEHNIDSFRSDHESSSFQRPTNNMNVASGSPLFMPLDGLSNHGYVKDETMFIKIIVD